MTWRWPSTAETCRHRLTNKYDPTTVVFWRTHPPSWGFNCNNVSLENDHTTQTKNDPFVPCSLVFIYICRHQQKLWDTCNLTMLPLFQQLTSSYLFCYIPYTDAGRCHCVFHSTLHLTLVHTCLWHFRGLKALCIDFAYSFIDCLHFHVECFQLPGTVFYGKVGGLTANHLWQYRNWERIINVGLLSIPWLKYT